MGLELIIKINNELYSGSSSPIRITDGNPTITWDFDQIDRVSIDEYTGIISSESEYGQAEYEIRISSSSVNVGFDSFIGNKIQTGFVDSQDRSWQYSGISLIRGLTYYGQIRITDVLDRGSVWGTLSFSYNSLPSVNNVLISPLKPSLDDDLSLDYDFYDDDGDEESGTLIKWFKNGSYQRQHDNSTSIESIYLQNNDIWYAEIYPSDGYEYGQRFSSQHVIVKRDALKVSAVHILPENPNEHDILKVDYILDDTTRNESLFVRWYINDRLDSDLNDKIYVHPDLVEGDTVSVEIKTESSTQYIASSEVIIQSSDFVVTDIVIDGKISPLDISSITPSIQWKSYIPTGKTVNYVSIKVGTFFNSGNIYSEIFNYSREVFTIPANLLKRGRDYYISIAISDTQVFTHYAYSHFRTNGSRWETAVDNATGWTLETMFSIWSEASEENPYQVIRVQDGSYFAEIQITSSKIILVSSSIKEYNIALSNFNTLVIAGKNNDIKIYLNNSLIINGEGLFTQSTTTKRLELGSMSENFEIYYKYFFYTVAGYYLPDSSSEFSSLQFYTWYEFEDSEIVALHSYKEGKKIFAVNPDNTNENSSIYSIVSGSVLKYGTTTRTFSPINKIRESPDKKNIVCAHSSGVSLIKGYAIGTYNQETLFIDDYNNITTNYPDQVGWELVKDTPYNGVYIDAEGLHINTL